MLFLLIILNFSRSLYFIYSYKVVPLRTEGQHYSRKTWLPSDTDQGSLNESMRVKRHILLKRSFKPLKINPACFRSSSQNDSVNDTCSPHTVLCNPFFLCLWFCRWVRESRVPGLLQACGVFLDHGGPGILCRCAQYDWRLVPGHLQEN